MAQVPLTASASSPAVVNLSYYLMAEAEAETEAEEVVDAARKSLKKSPRSEAIDKIKSHRRRWDVNSSSSSSSSEEEADIVFSLEDVDADADMDSEEEEEEEEDLHVQ